LAYFRLHGSPRTYWSAYDDAAVEGHAHAAHGASQHAAETWLIYDNTASGAATGNALRLQDRLSGGMAF
jgi:uncharacterized protein YecE (DUF72 family)